MQDFSKSVHDEKIRKRLGQYFTNNRVADLLVSVANMPKNCRCIDPMAGTGNMLVALLDKGQEANNIYAIEIDQVAGEICKSRIKKENMITGDAFDKDTHAKLPKGGWDLVITNPPYIRYQSMGKNQTADIELPTAKKIRSNLLETIEELSHLDATDKKLYKQLVKSYSGLSDVAVPAWILCAALIIPGGKLAIVVPSTWLNREYATIVQYMLLKWFDIEYVIEDGDCSWFNDALVRTEIIIAKRIKRRKYFLDIMEKTFISIKLSEKVAGKNNLIENIFDNCPKTLEEFRDFTCTNEFKNEFCSIKQEKIKSMFFNVTSEAEKNKWFHLCSRMFTH
jgi:16S rRNA G966 N2-methylase RsmD